MSSSVVEKEEEEEEQGGNWRAWADQQATHVLRPKPEPDHCEKRVSLNNEMNVSDRQLPPQLTASSRANLGHSRLSPTMFAHLFLDPFGGKENGVSRPLADLSLRLFCKVDEPTSPFYATYQLFHPSSSNEFAAMWGTTDHAMVFAHLPSSINVIVNSGLGLNYHPAVGDVYQVVMPLPEPTVRVDEKLQITFENGDHMTYSLANLIQMLYDSVHSEQHQEIDRLYRKVVFCSGIAPADLYRDLRSTNEEATATVDVALSSFVYNELISSRGVLPAAAARKVLKEPRVVYPPLPNNWWRIHFHRFQIVGPSMWATAQMSGSCTTWSAIWFLVYHAAGAAAGSSPAAVASALTTTAFQNMAAYLQCNLFDYTTAPSMFRFCAPSVGPALRPRRFLVESHVLTSTIMSLQVPKAQISTQLESEWSEDLLDEMVDFDVSISLPGDTKKIMRIIYLTWPAANDGMGDRWNALYKSLLLLKALVTAFANTGRVSGVSTQLLAIAIKTMLVRLYEWIHRHPDMEAYFPSRGVDQRYRDDDEEEEAAAYRFHTRAPRTVDPAQSLLNLLYLRESISSAGNTQAAIDWYLQRTYLVANVEDPFEVLWKGNKRTGSIPAPPSCPMRLRGERLATKNQFICNIYLVNPSLNQSSNARPFETVVNHWAHWDSPLAACATIRLFCSRKFLAQQLAFESSSSSGPWTDDQYMEEFERQLMLILQDPPPISRLRPMKLALLQPAVHFAMCATASRMKSDTPYNITSSCLIVTDIGQPQWNEMESNSLVNIKLLIEELSTA